VFSAPPVKVRNSLKKKKVRHLPTNLFGGIFHQAVKNLNLLRSRYRLPEDPFDGVWIQILPSIFFPDGTFRTSLEVVDYLVRLGVSGVIIAGPPWAYAGQDGPYSPLMSSSPKLAPEIGGEQALREFLSACARAGIRVAGDIVVNHVADQSDEVKAVKAGGDKTAQTLFRLVYLPHPDWWNQPNLFGGAPMLPVPELGPGWYRRNTFYPDQWDMNGANPNVIAYLIAVAKAMKELGYTIIRLDAIGHVGGPNLETSNGILTPTSFKLIQELRAVGLPLIAEVSGDRSFVAKYIEQGLSDGGYDFAIAAYALASLIDEDFTYVREYIAQKLPDNIGHLLLTLGVHDDINVSLAEPAIYKKVMEALGHNGEFVAFDRALNQRLGMLTTKKAHHLLLKLLMCLPGTAVLYPGDAERRQGNVHALKLNPKADPRTPRRDKMLWKPLKGNTLPPGFAPDALLPGVSVEEQLKNKKSPLQEICRFIAFRNKSTALQKGSYVILESNDSSVYTFARIYQEEVVIVMANPSRFPKKIVVEMPPMLRGKRLRRFQDFTGRWKKAARIHDSESDFEIILEDESISIFRAY
jgi:glycosidase